MTALISPLLESLFFRLQVYPIMGIMGVSISWMAYMGIYQLINNPDSVK